MLFVSFKEGAGGKGNRCNEGEYNGVEYAEYGQKDPSKHDSGTSLFGKPHDAAIKAAQGKGDNAKSENARSAQPVKNEGMPRYVFFAVLKKIITEYGALEEERKLVLIVVDSCGGRIRVDVFASKEL